MEIKNIPFDVHYQLNYITRTSKKEDGIVVVYKRNTFLHTLIDNGYLYWDEKDKLEDWIDNYAHYRVSDKFKNSTHMEILEKLTNTKIDDIMKQRVINISDVPWDYEDALESLSGSDGYMTSVDLNNDLFQGALTFHGFIKGCGPNGGHSTGTEKLSKCIEDDSLYTVIETITGKTEEENLKITENNRRLKEIDNMFKIAEKYGYSISN